MTKTQDTTRHDDVRIDRLRAATAGYEDAVQHFLAGYREVIESAKVLEKAADECLAPGTTLGLAAIRDITRRCEEQRRDLGEPDRHGNKNDVLSFDNIDDIFAQEADELVRLVAFFVGSGSPTIELAA